MYVKPDHEGNGKVMMKTRGNDSRFPGGRGFRRKRRRNLALPISTDYLSTFHFVGGPPGWWWPNNVGDLSSTAGTDRDTLLNGLRGSNRAFAVRGCAEDYSVTNNGGQTTSNRRLRQNWRKRHWRTSANDGDKNHHQSKTAATRLDLLISESMTDPNVSSDAIIYRHLQSTDGDHYRSNMPGKQQRHVLQVSCLFLPILAGAFWYWTKRRARKVATALGHDSACVTARGDGTGVPEGHYLRWYDGPFGDDEVDEYCAWYAGHASSGAGSRSPDTTSSLGGGSVGSCGATNANGMNAHARDAMAGEEAAGQVELASVLWIKGRPRRQSSRMARNVELPGASTSDVNGALMVECAPPSAAATTVRTADGPWQPIEDLYTLDVMEGGGLDLSPSGHDSSFFTDPCTDACSVVGSSFAGIDMPRFAPLTVNRGDRLRNACRSATPSPAGGGAGGENK